MKSSIHPCDLRSIRISDPLFGAYAALVAEKMIPYQWEALNDRIEGAEKSYCVRNFKIAAGEGEGEHQGVVFGDTDAYKWLQAVAYCIANGSGARFEATADSLIELISRAQEPDGYIDTYYSISHRDEKWSNIAEGHELYSAGHLIEAAVAYRGATGKTKLFEVATRCADLICKVFGPNGDKCDACPGHQEIELALIKLYKASDERRYLELAAHFIDVRGKQPNYLVNELKGNFEKRIVPEFCDYDEKYAQTQCRPAEQTAVEGHAVRAVYMCSAMADIARETGDEELKAACRRLWENLTTRRMYLTGGIGSSGHLERFTTDFDLPNDRMYCETCASVGLMMFGQRMALLNRDAKYYEVVERALCNTVLSGMAVSGEKYFYVNPLEVWPDNCLPSTSMSHVKNVRQSWFPCACCPTNVARTLASLGQYIYSEDDKSVYINQFISSSMKTSLQENEIEIEAQCSLMRDGTARISVSSSEAHPFTIRLRIPSYYQSISFTLDGESISPVVENGYAVLAVSRAGRQEFIVKGSVEPCFLAADERVRADAGKIALSMGPFVYCLEQTDNGDNLASVYASPLTNIKKGEPLSAFPGSLPTLSFEGVRLKSGVGEAGELYGKPQFKKESISLKALPYCLWCNREPGEMLVWMKALI